jgi:hypothetical protein
VINWFTRRNFCVINWFKGRNFCDPAFFIDIELHEISGSRQEIFTMIMFA